MLDKKSAACRKAAQRARQRIRSNKLPEMSSIQESQRVIDNFIKALRSRDMDKLQHMLTDDVVLYSDGGGEAAAAPKPIESMKKVSRFLISITEKTADKVSIKRTSVNNRPGYLAYMDDKLHSVWSFEIRDGYIQKIFSVLNPRKLKTSENPL